mmetsp:Transcript_29496/g.59374  ORF Transcript_29496/g.59374 Transcript_29496/m.59374 type:complete len:223 (-) Transcript_29496:198-866(-)
MAWRVQGAHVEQHAAPSLVLALEEIPRVTQRIKNQLSPHLGLHVVRALLIWVHHKDGLVVLLLHVIWLEKLVEADWLPRARRCDLVERGEQRADVLLLSLPRLYLLLDLLLDVALHFTVVLLRLLLLLELLHLLRDRRAFLRLTPPRKICAVALPWLLRRHIHSCCAHATAAHAHHVKIVTHQVAAAASTAHAAPTTTQAHHVEIAHHVATDGRRAGAGCGR